MTSVVALASNGDRPGRVVHFWCPGCEDAHGVTVDTPNGWTWNGDLEHPTFNPSVKVSGVQWSADMGLHKTNHAVAPGESTVCHSFVREGQIEFLSDCTHNLASQTVDLPAWPYSTE
jgi:hypothetical protein